MTEKYVLEVDMMKDNGQVIEKCEAINLLNELYEAVTRLRKENNFLK